MKLFAKKIDAETSTIKDVENAILSEMGNHTPGSPEHEILLSQLERVRKLIHQDPSWSFKPDANVILQSVMTVLSIVLITRFEKFDVLTSKAVSFIPKIFR